MNYARLTPAALGGTVAHFCLRFLGVLAAARSYQRKPQVPGGIPT